VPPSLYGFVKGRESVAPEDVAREFFSLPDNGGARSYVERVIADDPRFLWDAQGALCTADLYSLHPYDAPYVVFDIETTGSSAKEGAITEVGALKVVRGQVVDEFATLVNPKRSIEPFVVRLTGITGRMVAEAPDVSEIMPLFEEFIEGCVLVGHNAQFDCSFVAAARGGVSLPNPVLDTLKLARSLVPGLKRYRLSSLVSYFGVRTTPNHRALSDAAATVEVFLKLLKLLSSAGVRSVGEAAALRPHARIQPQKGHLAEQLPHTPGVYYFVDKHGTVLYVGKAKDLKSRVKTYFNGGDGRRKIEQLVREATEVRYSETRSELYALILEDREIKRLLPRYNSAGRSEKAHWFIKLDMNEAYPVPDRVHHTDTQKSAAYLLLGPYRSANVLDTCIEALGRIFPLRRCSESAETCFYGQIGWCAPCSGMSEEEYRAKVIGELVALLKGEGGEEHLKALIRERDRLAEELEFEAAARLRDLIAGIERIRLTRALASAEYAQAVVTPSTEPGIVEIFAFSEGRLVAHKGFEPEDAPGLTLFARSVLNHCDDALSYESADEARVVAAYLRRRRVDAEVVPLREAADLVDAVGKVAERAAKVDASGD